MRSPRTQMGLFSKLFPAPAYLTLQPAGIDVSPKAIRAVRLKQETFGFVPDITYEKIFEEECALLESNEDLKKCEPLRAALQGMQKELELEFVSVSLPETKTYIFKTSVPHEALATLDDALVVKLQENVPLDPSEIVYDYTVLPATKGQSMIDVVVTAFPKGVIAAYTKLFKEFGMTVISFESESQSGARAIIRTGDTTPYLLLNFGYTQINLAIIERGQVHYTSSIPYSSEEITGDYNGQSAHALKTKINKLLVYWFTNKHNPEVDEKIANVLLTGPFSTADGLVDFLERSLRINVDVANVWQNCFDLNEHVPQMAHKESVRYGTAIGLALRN